MKDARLSHFRRIVAKCMGVDQAKLLPQIKLITDSQETFGKRTPSPLRVADQIDNKVVLNVGFDDQNEDADKEDNTASSPSIHSSPEKIQVNDLKMLELKDPEIENVKLYFCDAVDDNPRLAKELGKRFLRVRAAKRAYV